MFICSIAEPWIGESAVIECRKAMSSTQVARCGNRSLTHLPHWPYCLNFHFGPTTRPWFFVPAAAEGLDRDRLAVQLVQLRLVVERIDLAGTAVHEQEDDALGLRRQRRLLRSERIAELRHALGGAGLLGEEVVQREQAGQREAGEAGAGFPEELAAGAAAKGASEVGRMRR